MKECLLLCSIAFLMGCAGSGDHLPDIQNANVDLKGMEPCLTYTVTPGDRISSIQIGSKSGESDSFRKNFSQKPFSPKRGQCLPVFGYHFVPGKHYTVYYSVDNASHKRERIIQGSFTAATH